MKPSKALCIPEKAARILPVHRSLSTLVGRKQTVVRVQFSPQEPLGSRLWFTRTGVQHSPGSSAVEPPYAPAESGATHPIERYQALCDSVPCLSRAATSRRAPNWGSEEARTWEHHPQPTIPPPLLLLLHSSH